MRVSTQGKFALAIKEGLVPAPYLDSVNVWTFGIGHAETSGLSRQMATMADASNVQAVQIGRIEEQIGGLRGDISRLVSALERSGQ